ncbi:nSTAND1 domain-containing NTPase [Streptomyces griseosporeus]|uniref:nSTAND1 domain-containing NTPase n=1 Tax=Streptomyces griseosporeus TaxID=1910 RepID=UPI003702A2BC
MTSTHDRTGDSFTSDLPAAVACVISPDGAVAGAGFLVADGMLATCAHVVAAAGSGPGETVLLDFPRVQGVDAVRGRVRGELWRSPEDGDVAFIQLKSTPPSARALPLGSAEGCRGHPVRSFGFPSQAPAEGHFGFGVAGDLLPGSNGRGALLQLTAANDLTTGFSGGPVLDELTGLVIGMLTEITAPDAFDRGLGVGYATPTQVLREVLPELAEREVCPYRGLEPFTAEHARWFQGRKEAVQQVLTNLARQRRLTLLLGPSGSGKSSLVQAGVLQALTEGEVPGSDQWMVVLARPRQDLAAEIERAGLPGTITAGVAAAVTRRLAAEPDHQRLLLVIDQFEELFIQAVNGHHRNRLAVVDQIAEAVDSHTDLSVILVMRDDFYPQLAALAPRLLAVATPGLLNVPGTLNQRDLRDIITLPARDVGLHFQPGLAEQIITDVLAAAPEGTSARQAPATMLPLLELTLRQLWLRRKDGHLTHEAYRRIGAVSGSLTTWCDSALDELSSKQRPVARRALTALVHPADPSRRVPAVRAQVPLRELRDLATGSDDTPDGDVDTVVANLTRHRIITTQTLREPQRPDAPPGEPVAELIHDALIRDWGTLREWVRQDRRFHEWLDRTRERQGRWATTSDPGDLLGGTALAEGLEWSEKRRLPGDITTFLSASKDRQRAAIRRSRRLNTILACLLALALVAASGALWQWRTAVTARHAAQSRQLAAQSRQLATQSASLISANPELASLLAVQAYRTSHTPEAEASLQDAAALPLHRRLSGHAHGVESVAFSPDGRTVASGSTDASVRLWDITTGTTRSTLKEKTAAVASVAFSPDGRTLASGRSDGTVRLWDVASGTARTTLIGHTNQVNTVAFSPDGRTLATGGLDNTVRLWDVAAGKTRNVLRGHTDFVQAVAFSPDGRTLASGSSDGTVRLWNVATGTNRMSFPALDTIVESVAYSPDGRTLATANQDQTLRLWDAATGKARVTLEGDADSVAFSPDGRTLATGSTNHSVQLWDVATGAIRATLVGHTDEVVSVTFSPDGRTLATGSHDRTVRLWQMSDRTTLTGHTSGVSSVAFSPDGHTLATGSLDATVKLWDLSTGRPRTTLTQDASVLSVAFSPDGRTVATGSYFDPFVRLWDVASGKVRTTLNAHAQNVNVVAFSGDGRTFASGDSEGTVRLWDVASGKTRTTVNAHIGAVESLAFSPDGRILATGSYDRTVRLWDVTTGKPRNTFSGHTDRVTSVAFSPDGRTLATGSYDRTVRLWDVATGKTRATLIGHTDLVESVAFSPDGRTLATGSDDLTAQLWDVASGRTRAALQGHSDIVQAVAFSPDGRTLATGSYDFTARLWNAVLPQPAEAMKKICQAVNRDLTPEERTAYLPGQPVAHVCRSR